MHTLEEVRAEYNRLDTLLEINTSRIELKISARAVRQLGCFRTGPKPCISISKLAMEDDTLFLDTIRHEYAHAAAWLMYPGQKQGHNALWKSICRRIGCVPRSRTKLSDDAAELRAQRSRYTIRCRSCGRESLYLRKGKMVQLLEAGRGRYLRCTKCGGNDFELETK